MITPILIETRRNATLDVSPPSRSRSSQSHVRMDANTLSRVACLPQAKSGQAHGHPRARTRRILRDVPVASPACRNRTSAHALVSAIPRHFAQCIGLTAGSSTAPEQQLSDAPCVPSRNRQSSTGEVRAAVGQPQLRARHAAGCLLSARRSRAAARRPRFALFLRRTKAGRDWSTKGPPHRGAGKAKPSPGGGRGNNKDDL
jgi:hypothetical protein